MTADGADRPVELLAPAAHLALAVARRDAGSAGAPPPPARLRPFLSFRRPLPARAVAAALAVLDEDTPFRERVAEAFDEAGVGAEGHDGTGGAAPGDGPEGDGPGEDDVVVAAVRAFLLRPAGWEEELAEQVERSASAARARETAAADRSAARRVAQLESTLERVRADAAGVRARLEEERSARRAAEDRTGRAEEALAAVRSELAEAERRRARAVHDLATARDLAEERLEELRRLRTAVAPDEVAPVDGPATPSPAAPSPAAPSPATPSPTTPGPPPEAGTDLAAAADLLDRAARMADELRALVQEASDGLGGVTRDVGAGTTSGGAAMVPEGGRSGPAAAPAATPAATPAVSRSAGPGRGPRPARPRRSPVGVRRGVMADTAAAVDQLLRVPRMVAVVDGYNVSMEGWPALDHGGQREQLLRLLSGVVARTGAEVHVVFDGDAEGRRPSVFAPMPVRVHFSAAGVEADEVVLDLVARLPVDRPVLVVSSDREVRDGAARRGADTTSSASLLDWGRR